MASPSFSWAFWYLGAAAASSSVACSNSSASAFPFTDGGATDMHDGAALENPDAQFSTSTCPNGEKTSLLGSVYDPAGKNPLYNVTVYVPSVPIEPFPSGATCASCDSLFPPNPIAVVNTGTDGTFTLKGVPSGRDIPLVIQVGKWRRQLRVDVNACEVNTIPDGSLTLPNNHEVGDIPFIAVSIGGADTLECLFRRMGIDASEYGPGGNSPGRIQIFNGAGPQATTNPPAPTSYVSLWDSAADLEKYDLLLLSCEGNPMGTSHMTTQSQQALVDYTSHGGRVFASHYHDSWFEDGPFSNDNLANWDFGGDAEPDSITADIVTSFPKGVAFRQWLEKVDALTGVNNSLPIVAPRFDAQVTASNTPSQAWISADQSAGTNAGATEYFSFNTPVGAPAAQQCGRIVFSDLHVAGAVMPPDYSLSQTPSIPDDCTMADLTPQEKALEFMIFDISSCVTPDDQPPPVPQ